MKNSAEESFDKNIRKVCFLMIISCVLFAFVFMNVASVRGEEGAFYSTSTGEVVQPGDQEDKKDTQPIDPSIAPQLQGQGLYLDPTTQKISPGSTSSPTSVSGEPLRTADSVTARGSNGLDLSYGADRVGIENARLNSPSSGGSSPSGGGGGGGGSAGGGGGSGNEMLSALSSIVSLVSSALSSVKAKLEEAGAKTKSTTELRANGDEWFTNQEGDSSVVMEKENDRGAATGEEVCDYEDMEVCENVTRKDCVGNESLGEIVKCNETNVKECKMKSVCVLKEDALENNPLGLGEPNEDSEVKPSITGNVVSGNFESDANKKTTRLQVNNKEKKGSARVDNNLNMEVTNIRATIPGIAQVLTPEDLKTTIFNSPNSATLRPRLTGEVISESATGSQYVKFMSHDLDMNGKDIDVIIYKSFDKVDGYGTNLEIENGDTLVVFDESKILYPRQIYYTPYVLNSVVNGYDARNEFKIIKGGVKGNYLVDANKKLTTVGQEVVSNPMEGYDGIIISKAREEMWNKAAGVW